MKSARDKRSSAGNQARHAKAHRVESRTVKVHSGESNGRLRRGSAARQILGSVLPLTPNFWPVTSSITA